MIFFVSKSSVIDKSASLKESNEPITTINSGQSVRYAYGIWVYVNTWDTTREKTIFSRKDNIRLYLAANEPSLYCSITCMSKDGSSLVDQNILITDNFGIQKWVYVVISSDNTIIDTYCRHEFFMLTNQNELRINNSDQSIQILHNLQEIDYQGTHYWIDSKNLVYQRVNHLLSLVGIYNPELSLLYYS